MAEQLLNMTGLTYFKGLCDTKYDNKIEKIKVNGGERVPVNKEVNITVDKIDVSRADERVTWTNVGSDSDYNASLSLTATGANFGIEEVGFVDLASKYYVDNNAGKIDNIYLNSTAVPIISKGAYISAAEMSIEGDYDVVGARVHFSSEGSGSASNNLTITKTNDGVSIHAVHDDGMPDGFNVEVYSKAIADAKVQEAIAAAQIGVTWNIVPVLPATGEPGKMYLKGPGGSGTNIYEEWIWINSGTTESPNWHWENIGTTAIDLSGYLKQEDIEIITTAQIDALFASASP